MNSLTLCAITTKRNLIPILFLGLVGPALLTSSVMAQATTAITYTRGAGDLGTRTIPHGHTIQIVGGTISEQGSEINLFHSFNQFSVGPGDTAQFLNTTPSLHTANILGRVTGGNPSILYGTIDTMSYPGANLFLMNPAGIVFGPNATLDVGGSVAFSTANYIRLENANGSNAGIFHADTSSTSLLTSASVVAFGFLSQEPAAIAVQESRIAVAPSQSIFFVGGNQGFTYTTTSDTDTSPSVPGGVTVTGGSLTASGGQIGVASVSSPGEILGESLGKAPNINGQSFEALGTVQISQNSKLDISGEGGGTILIRGGRLVVDASTIFASSGQVLFDTSSIQITDGARIGTRTNGAANAGNVVLNAEQEIELDTSVLVGSVSDGPIGHAGNISISTAHGNINLGHSSIISQTISSSGNTGTINVDAPTGNIILDRSSIFNTADGTGKLGDIRVGARNLLLRNGSSIGGDNFTSQFPGSIAITLDHQLSLTEGSFINTQAFGRADSASLIIKASKTLITGKDSSDTHSGLYAGTVNFGNGGQLTLFTDTLQLENGGLLSSKSSIGSKGTIASGHGGDIHIEGYKNVGSSVTIDGPGSGIFASAEGIGTAGNINVRSTSLTLQNGGEISAETTGISSKATGGSIIINATDQVTLTNGASITASSEGSADAGNIFIDAGQQLDLMGTSTSKSSITTEAKESSGGNIDIKAIDRIRLVNGTISTSVLAEDGKGGNIFIDPKVVMLQGSTVAAQAVGGAGGNITFVTPLFLKDSTSSISAKSESGLNGAVTIQSPVSNLSGTVGQLASKTSPPQVLLQNRCVALAGGEQSTFILAGRDALPSEPGGWLSSPVAIEHWTGEGTEDHASGLLVQRSSQNGYPILAAIRNEAHAISLRRLTPPGFLVRMFATGTTGCPS